MTRYRVPFTVYVDADTEAAARALATQAVLEGLGEGDEIGRRVTYGETTGYVSGWDSRAAEQEDG